MSNDSIKAKTIVGMIWSAIQKFGCAFLSFITNIVLARLLTPDDFGCIGLITIFILVSQIFIDGGFGDALVQKNKSTQRDYSTIFYWNLALSVTIYGSLFISSEFISRFFNIENLGEILRSIGLILIINAIGFISRNRLRKKLNFKAIAIIEVVASSISTIIAIVSAYNGFGVYSLVFFNLSNSIIKTVLFILTERWLPSLVFDWESFKQLFSFGSFILLSDLLNTICDNIQGIIIGKLYLPSTMGYYAQAKKLEEVPNTTMSGIVTQVSFPIFAQIKDSVNSIYAAHRKCFICISYFSIPIILFLIVAAKPIILLLYTQKWENSIFFFQILCLGATAYCIQSVNYQLFVALGYSKQMFKWNIFKRVIGIVLIACSSVAGVTGLLFACSFNMWLVYIVNGILAGKKSGYSLYKQIKELLPIVIISVVAGCSTYFVAISNINNSLLSLVFSGFLYFSLFLALSKLLNIEALSIYLDIIKSKIRNDR